MKYLGIDYGSKRIGIARSDDTGTLAFPLTTIVAGKDALSKVHELAMAEGAAKIILGESKNFKGEANVVMEDIEQFKVDLEDLTQLPVVYEAEVFSSALAARQFEGDFGRKEKPNQDALDASAAAVLLQSFLDKNKK